MDDGEYLSVKVGDIVESTCFDAYTTDFPQVFLLLRDAKMYPKQIYWGERFPFGGKELVVSVRKCYAKLLYRHEEV